MQGYVPGQDEAFAESRRCFGELEDWMASEEAAGLQHGELEEQLDVRGRELLRGLFQDRPRGRNAGMTWPGRTGFRARGRRMAVPGRWSRSSGRSRCPGSRTGRQAGRMCTR
jgi:hypothetical protein